MKRMLSLLTAVFLLALLGIPVSAAQTPESCVFDTAGLLTDEEYWTLEDYAQEISEQRQCAVYFVTVDDFRSYGDGDIFNVARQIFLDNDFGMGESRDGVMLILSMAERDYCLDYLACTDELLSQAREGNIYDRGSWITSGVLWLWSLVLGAVTALIVCLIQRGIMSRKVRMQSNAMEYLQGDVNITRKRDVYSHTTEIRHKIEKNNSGSSGDHSHSGGFSGKSGKF